jgi:hypothetical protein
MNAADPVLKSEEVAAKQRVAVEPAAALADAFAVGTVSTERSTAQSRAPPDMSAQTQTRISLTPSST